MHRRAGLLPPSPASPHPLLPEGQKAKPGELETKQCSAGHRGTWEGELLAVFKGTMQASSTPFCTPFSNYLENYDLQTCIRPKIVSDGICSQKRKSCVTPKTREHYTCAQNSAQIVKRTVCPLLVLDFNAIVKCLQISVKLAKLTFHDNPLCCSPAVTWRRYRRIV